MELVQVTNFSFSYGQATHNALKTISFRVSAGEFILLCGASGSGKSTLLANLKPELRPTGTSSGSITFDGTTLTDLDRLHSACDIGFVMQDVDSQMVTDTVRAELCFGLESLGFPPDVIRRRVAEMASFFGLGRLLDQNVETLSSGQKQTVNLASVLALSPRLVLLDEPTSQLDPVASRDFLSMLLRLNRELGITVMIAEHNTEALFSQCSRVMAMDNGRLCFDGDKRECAAWMAGQGEPFSSLLPCAARIFGTTEPVPLTVAEGRLLFEKRIREKHPPTIPPQEQPPEHDIAIRLKGVAFGYHTMQQPILRGLDFTVYHNEITAVMGDNGSGKTTLLKLLCGLLKPIRGKVSFLPKAQGIKAAYLPSNTKLLFVRDTIREDLLDVGTADIKNKEQLVIQHAQALGIAHLLDCHPYDVSAGERQRAALAKVLLSNPGLVLLDEPTKALDPAAKEQLAAVLKQLIGQGVTVVMASHDTMFCAQYCDRCVLLFDGAVACSAPPRAFFGGNAFYTTPASLIASGYRHHAVTCEEVRRLWQD